MPPTFGYSAIGVTPTRSATAGLETASRPLPAAVPVARSAVLLALGTPAGVVVAQPGRTAGPSTVSVPCC